MNGHEREPQQDNDGQIQLAAPLYTRQITIQNSLHSNEDVQQRSQQHKSIGDLGLVFVQATSDPGQLH